MNGNLERLLTTKQEELRAITVWKVVELEKKYIAKEKECREQGVKIKGLMTTFDSMRSDFAYNLELLRERDLELERYDKFVKQYRESLNEKDFENVKHQQVIKELRSRINELEEEVTKSEAKVGQSEAKVSELSLEVVKLTEEKTKDSDLALQASESTKLQCKAEVDVSRRAIVAAEQAAKKEALQHDKEMEVLKGMLEKSESARNQAEMDLRALRRENQSKIQAMKARTNTLESNMEKLTILKERLECENMEKSHTLVEQRKRVEDIQEEIMCAYKGKVKKLIDELTMMKDQHAEQRAIFQEQLEIAEQKQLTAEQKHLTSEQTLIDREAAHKIDLETASKELDRLELMKEASEQELDATRIDLERKVDDAQHLVNETKAQLVKKDDALIALNADLESVMRREEDLKCRLNNQTSQFDFKLEKANEQLRKSTKETDMLRARDESQHKMVEASFLEEKRKFTDLVHQLREERDDHKADLSKCRQELRSAQDEVENQQNRALALEEQGTSIRHVITDMRLEMEKMRKKFKIELDRKVEELARYKHKDYEMKHKLANLQVEKDEITLNGSFDTSDIQRELRETKQKLNQLSNEREHLMDINNCLKSDLNKAIHTFTPLRGVEYTPLSHTTFNDSPWARGSTIMRTNEPSPPTMKRTRLQERLDEIKSELAEHTRS